MNNKRINRVRYKFKTQKNRWTNKKIKDNRRNKIKNKKNRLKTGVNMKKLMVEKTINSKIIIQSKIK